MRQNLNFIRIMISQLESKLKYMSERLENIENMINDTEEEINQRKKENIFYKNKEDK